MELVGYEDDEARSPTSFSSWVVHSEYEKNCSTDNIKKVKLYDYKTEALLPIIKYYNKMALWFEKNGHFPKRKQEFFVYSQNDINFILSQVVNPEIVNITKYPDFDQCFWLTLKSY